MKSQWFRKSFLVKMVCVASLMGSSLYANIDDDFSNSAKAFFDEGHVFQGESKRLMDNTHQVDKALIDFEHILMVPHRTAQALKSLDSALETIKIVLMAAEQVPEVRMDAEKLKHDLEIIHKPVSEASKTMQKVDAKVVPLLNVTHKAEVVAGKLVTIEDKFRHVGIDFINGVGLVSQCEHDGVIIDIMNHSRIVYTDIDKEMRRINDTYDNVKKIPERSTQEIAKEIEKIRVLEEPLVRLIHQLDPLLGVLNDLRHVLDKRIGVKPGYPCGADICHKEQSYPCGTKTCTKHVFGKKIHYPCGVKTCKEKVPYPCGVKTCHVDITMSVSDALKGADAIEHQIEAMLSATAYKALKEIGLGSIIKDLEHQANGLVRPILSKLHLNIDTRLPRLDVDIDMKLIDMGIADITKFEAELEKLGVILDMRSPTFSPYAPKLDKLNLDIKSVLNSPRCHAVKR